MSAAVTATQDHMRSVLEEQQKMLTAAEADVQELRHALNGEMGVDSAIKTKISRGSYDVDECC